MKVNKIEDYSPLEFDIVKTYLDFNILDKEVIVKSKLHFKRVQGNNQRIELNGVDLKLLEIKINDDVLSNYKYENELLSFESALDEFVLYTKVSIDPYNNTSCEGLYKSGDILCSQNEAEGFRKITFFYDRPDCMSVFETTVSGDVKKYPFLLSNGNMTSQNTKDSRQTVTWVDPYKKPCYLFALVAGDLAKVSDTFTTRSNKKVALEFFVDHGNEDKCFHAVESLKNCMKWDEDVYGLEYDLDIYMVVAVDTFNMGAMENKGLNIFNSKYVLAKKETATDADFQGVEAVIGHEYFHNWTGNRVTCRDWFQLTLKEGLTVFRDQEFSADMLSRSVKRIEDVKGLRSHQYSEDASGLSHPIKPKSYVEMNNFYTSTVYEKGAEVIRMIHTIIGKDNFRAGMDLYFKRHDGQAVTTEDFVAAMSDASDIDLEQFKVWYDQNGTPVVKVLEEYSDNEYKLTLSQSSKLNNDEYDALMIPMSIALFDSKGSKTDEHLLTLDGPSDTFVFECKERPVLSINRNFTAPVILDFDRTIEDNLFLMKHDDDLFVKYESCLNIMKDIINSFINDAPIDTKAFIEAYKSILVDPKLENAFKAYILNVPSYQDILNKQETLNIVKTHSACSKLKSLLTSELEADYIAAYKSLQTSEFDLSAYSMGTRSFKNLCLKFISLNDGNKSFAQDQFDNATNMTDELAALSCLYNSYNDEASLKEFYSKWKDDTLVIQKWFALQASGSSITVEKLKELESNEVFDIEVPNLVRSLIGQFIANNILVLTGPSGTAYAFDKISEIDKLNPQVASRLVKNLSIFEKLNKEDYSDLFDKYEQFKKNKFSKDVTEVLENIKV